MNEETERLLKQLGFCLGDAKPDPASGTLTWFRPREPGMSIEVFPASTPAAIVQAIYNAGASAARKDIAAKHQAYLHSFHD